MGLISSLINMVAGSLASSKDVNDNFEALRLASNENTVNLSNLASCFFRQPATQYYLDEVIYIPNTKYCLVCLEEGITSDIELDLSNIADNINIVDGSVTWRVGKRNKIIGCALTNGSALPIGTIISSCIVLDDTYTYASTNGAVINYTENPDFYNHVLFCADNNKLGYCTIETYNKDLEKYGQCGYFVIDRINKTVKLPTITRFIGSLNNISEIGKTYRDQIRNITAYFWSGISDNCSGAASQATSGEQGGGNLNALTGGYISFDASKQVPTGSENYPKHTRYPYYIVISQSTRKGLDGVDGKDGISPSIEVLNDNGNCYLKITDKNGTVSTPNLNANTPVKGIDYFTEADVREISKNINSEKIILTQTNIEAVENTVIDIDLNISIYKITPTSGMNISFNASNIPASENSVITFEVLVSFPEIAYTVNFLNVTWIEDNIDFSEIGNHLFVFRSFDSGLTWIGNLQGSW